MIVRHVAWFSSVLLGVVTLILVSAILFFRFEADQFANSDRADELLMTRLELLALEQWEMEIVDRAQQLMIQRVCVGLTRLQAIRDQMDPGQRSGVDDAIRRFAAYRERNSQLFLEKEEWWLDRFDGWIDEVEGP